MIESTGFPQKGREKYILATNQAENQHSTKIKTKKKEDLPEVKFESGSGFVLRRCIWEFSTEESTTRFVEVCE